MVIWRLINVADATSFVVLLTVSNGFSSSNRCMWHKFVSFMIKLRHFDFVIYCYSGVWQYYHFSSIINKSSWRSLRKLAKEINSAWNKQTSATFIDRRGAYWTDVIWEINVTCSWNWVYGSARSYCDAIASSPNSLCHPSLHMETRKSQLKQTKSDDSWCVIVVMGCKYQSDNVCNCILYAEGAHKIIKVHFIVKWYIEIEIQH